MKGIIILSLLFTLLLASKCRKDSDNCHVKIYFTNKSNNSVFVIGGEIYPDTILNSTYINPLGNSNQYEVQPSNTSYNPLTVRAAVCVEDWFIKPPKLLKKDTLMVFVFDKAVLQNNNWDSIKKYNMYLKRYDLSLQDLQNRNWTITYP